MALSGRPATLRFVVVADSHIRFPDDDVDTYPSNALMVERNQHVVDLCNQIDAGFVVHLGDIVHPLPVEAAHEPAVQLASEVYAGLRHPIHYVAGNHDIGDKPNALVAVPAVADENYSIYERYWGPAFRSFEIDDCHFVIVDTPVLNSGLAREDAQRRWLEADLNAAADAGLRIFLFTHYPPFVRDRHEAEHYDNLGEPARSWLLDLLADHGVEALFAGHVHNFLYNRHGATDLYVLPATGFVRPDYSELAAVAPESEGGRDDPAKLGFFVVDVGPDGPDGHQVSPVRTYGAVGGVDAAASSLDIVLRRDWETPLGVTLRHGWMSTVDFPTAGLDEFGRKTVRNDALLLALWEARIRDVRVPVADVATLEGAARVRHLADRGMRFSVRSAGVPDPVTRDAVLAVSTHIVRWEITVLPEQFAATATFLAGHSMPDGLTVAIAPIVPLGSPGAAVHHFVSCGFVPVGDDLLERWCRLDPSSSAGEVVFRVAAGDPIAAGVAAAGSTAKRVRRDAVVIAELPRGGENTVFGDDEAVAAHVAAVAAAARDNPDSVVFLDAFMDHDRSYYPRHGLIDRRFNPRLALRRLMEEASR